MTILPDFSGTRLNEELVVSYIASGGWSPKPLGSYLRESARACPETVAAVSYRDDHRTDMTFIELEELVDRLRSGLRQVGVGIGDAVSVMLPNSIEGAATIWAIILSGAVYSGIPVAYGRRETEFMVRRANSKVLVIPDQFRGNDFIQFADEIRRAVPNLEQIVVVGKAIPAGFTAFEELQQFPPLEAIDVEASSLVHFGFTSGTTGEPKAVMNTHQTLDCVLKNWVNHVHAESLGNPLVDLIASPVGHHTGFLWGVLLTSALGGTGIYLDRWEPNRVVEIMNRERVSVMFGAPTFLQDLLRVTEEVIDPIPSLQFITVAGAPIPRSMVSVARHRLGCFVCPAWGMTEYGIGVSATPVMSPDRIEATDGLPVPGCDVRIVDPSTGERCASGKVGALEMTGPGLFLGYKDRPDVTEDEFVEGWFQTGDLAVQDDDGCVSLQGRTKDIVIRGGENIPIGEIEDLLYQHRLVEEVAVVGYPDPRLGERVCAVVVFSSGSHLLLPEICDYLLTCGLSKHYLPERLEVLRTLPKTASGKIKKNELRAMLF